MKRFFPPIISLGCLLLAACSGAQVTPAPVSAITMETTAVSPSPLPIINTPLPTETSTPTPTATLRPTATPTLAPTATQTPLPAPTATLQPSDTPSSTASPLALTTAVPRIATISLNELTSHVGEKVTVSGQVTAVSSFSNGFKFTLDDGNGRVILLMWHDVYDKCWDTPQLNIGATVKASGEVGEYEGTLQITPDFGGDVTVITPGAAFAPPRDIGDLGAYIDERVAITGTVIRVEGTSAGAKLFISDETGEILVFIWQSILDRVEHNTSLGVSGTKVRVTGYVQIYQSNREIVPILPYDIEILP